MVSDYPTILPVHSSEIYCTPCMIVQIYNFKCKILLCKKHYYNYWNLCPCKFGRLLLQNSNLEMLFSDSNYYKAQALKNAEDAYQIHQARVCIFWIREVEKKAE